MCHILQVRPTVHAMGQCHANHVTQALIGCDICRREQTATSGIWSGRGQATKRGLLTTTRRRHRGLPRLPLAGAQSDHHGRRGPNRQPKQACSNLRGKPDLVLAVMEVGQAVPQTAKHRRWHLLQAHDHVCNKNLRLLANRRCPTQPVASIPARGPTGRTPTLPIFEIAQQQGFFRARIRNAFLGVLTDERLVTQNLMTPHAQRFITELLIRVHGALKVAGRSSGGKARLTTTSDQP